MDQAWTHLYLIPLGIAAGIGIACARHAGAVSARLLMLSGGIGGAVGGALLSAWQEYELGLMGAGLVGLYFWGGLLGLLIGAVATALQRMWRRPGRSSSRPAG